jgi:ABC-2 type transport system permease protein
MLRAAGTILAKDLRLRLRDRSVLVFGLLVPLGLTVLFSFIFSDAEDLVLTAAVVDEDGGAVAAGFVEEVVPGLVDDGVVTLVDLADRRAVETALREGTLDAAWILPTGFSDAVIRGRPARLEVLVNADRALRGEIARGVAEGYVSRLEAIGLAIATVSTVAPEGGVTPDQLGALGAELAASGPVVRLSELETRSRQLDATSYLAAGMAAFFVFFTVQFGVTGLLEETQQGTMPRLLAAPIVPAAIHVGKASVATVLGLGSMTVLAIASRLLLGAYWGAPLGVAILIVAIVASAIGLMTLVGSFARTAEQAGNLQSIVAIVLGMMGGVFFPIPLGEGILGVFGRIAPHGWFIRGLGDLVGSESWTVVLPAAGAMVAFGVATGSLAALRLRRSLTW